MQHGVFSYSVQWLPPLLRDWNWPRINKCTHLQEVSSRLEGCCFHLLYTCPSACLAISVEFFAGLFARSICRPLRFQKYLDIYLSHWHMQYIRGLMTVCFHSYVSKTWLMPRHSHRAPVSIQHSLTLLPPSWQFSILAPIFSAWPNFKANSESLNGKKLYCGYRRKKSGHGLVSPLFALVWI